MLAGLVLPTLALVSYRRLRSIEASVPPAARLDVVERVPIFAPLSLAAKEQVAAELGRGDRSSPGEAVIRAGGVGDRFYIVRDGELDGSGRRRGAATAGRAATSARSHSCATFRARRPSPLTTTAHLYALRRDDFLAAVTGHERAREAADAVVAARLPASA